MNSPPPSFHIADRPIGPEHPTYIIAEMSANHGQELDQAIRLVEEARNAGADAIKLQTYTPETITLHCDNEHFRIDGTPWAGRTLYDLYAEAYTPWEWHGRLQEAAEGVGLDFFSTAFDPTAIDFLEDLGVPVHKTASFEIVDLPLIQTMAATGKPLILSTGMATLQEIREAVDAAREAGAEEIAVLKCTSAYPAPPESMNLRSIPYLASELGVPVGLSDHTLGTVVPVAAVALGSCIIEKHFTMSRAVPGPDSAFSLEPAEFKAMVDSVRTAEKALGKARLGTQAADSESRIFRRSLFVVEPVGSGEAFTKENVRSIRPGYGLPPKHLDEVVGKRAVRDIDRGTPMAWSLIVEDE